MDNRFYDRVDDGDYNTWGNYDVENQYLLGDEQRLFLERLIHEYELNLIYSTDGEESLYINILTKIESDSTKKILERGKYTETEKVWLNDVGTFYKRELHRRKSNKTQE